MQPRKRYIYELEAVVDYSKHPIATIAIRPAKVLLTWWLELAPFVPAPAAWAVGVLDFAEELLELAPDAEAEAAALEDEEAGAAAASAATGVHAAAVLPASFPWV